jgi:dipeptidyl aminopeptidase/acylaminoacyl peptidase
MKPTCRYTIEQFMNTVKVSGISFSPDNSMILLTSNQPGISNAFAAPVNGGQMRQLTFSLDEPIRAISYFPKDSRILYTKDTGGIENTHLCVLEENGDETVLTCGERVNTGFRRWSLDNNYFYCVTNERDRRYFDGYKINAETYERELIFQGGEGDSLIDIIIDDQLATVVKNTGTNDSDLYLYDLRTKTMRNITSHVGKIVHFPVYFDRQRLELYYTSQEGESWSLYRINVETEQAHCIEKREANLIHVFYSENMKHRALIIYENGRRRSEIYNCSTGERINLKPSSNGVISSVGFSKSEELMGFYINGDCTPNELYVCDLTTNEIRKLASGLNPEIDPVDLVESQEVTFSSFDGLKIPCLLWKPHEAGTEQKCPALVWVHGGPVGQIRKNYAGAVQYLVNHGYVVLGVNHRGSGGYGKEFMAAADRKQGREPLWDCVEAKRYLAGLDFVDEENIGIIGGSFGGYMVLAALAFHPEEFAAGVDIAGVSNMVRALKTLPKGTESQKLFYEKVGNPDADREMLEAISPIFHSHNICRPLMVLHGVKDPRVSKIESDDIVEAVQRNGGIVEYLILNDEAHGFRKRDNSTRSYRAILNFLNRHLKRESDQLNCAGSSRP